MSIGNFSKVWKIQKVILVQINLRGILKLLMTLTLYFLQAHEDILSFNEEYFIGEVFDEPNVNIQGSEILKACKEMKKGKPSGPDLMLKEFFMNGIQNICFTKYLTKLFKKPFTTGYFPVCWSEGFIIPLYKKEKVNEPENYRGITLVSTFGKLFNKILNRRLTQ